MTEARDSARTTLRWCRDEAERSSGAFMRVQGKDLLAFTVSLVSFAEAPLRACDFMHVMHLERVRTPALEQSRRAELEPGVKSMKMGTGASGARWGPTERERGKGRGKVMSLGARPRMRQREREGGKGREEKVELGDVELGAPGGRRVAQKSEAAEGARGLARRRKQHDRGSSTGLHGRGEAWQSVGDGNGVRPGAMRKTHACLMVTCMAFAARRLVGAGMKSLGLRPQSWLHRGKELACSQEEAVEVGCDRDQSTGIVREVRG